MVATFNGWDDMPEVEREALEVWEQEQMCADEEVLGLGAATEMPGFGKPSGEAVNAF
jgi:hypothetical protein